MIRFQRDELFENDSISFDRGMWMAKWGHGENRPNGSKANVYATNSSTYWDADARFEMLDESDLLCSVICITDAAFTKFCGWNMSFRIQANWKHEARAPVHQAGLYFQKMWQCHRFYPFLAYCVRILQPISAAFLSWCRIPRIFPLIVPFSLFCRHGSNYVGVFQRHNDSLLYHSDCMDCWSVRCNLLHYANHQKTLAEVCCHINITT